MIRILIGVTVMLAALPTAGQYGFWALPLVAAGFVITWRAVIRRGARTRPLFSQQWIEGGAPTWGVGGEHGAVEYLHGTGELYAYPARGRTRHLHNHVGDLAVLADAGNSEAIYALLSAWYWQICAPAAPAAAAVPTAAQALVGDTTVEIPAAA